MDLQKRLVGFLRDLIGKEFSSIGFKLLVGSILVSTIVFSIIELGIVLRTFLERYENGIVLEMAGFGIVIIACSVALYFLFRLRFANVSSEPIPEEYAPAGVKLQMMIFRFGEGVVEGFLSRFHVPKDEGVILHSDYFIKKK